MFRNYVQKQFFVHLWWRGTFWSLWGHFKDKHLTWAQRKHTLYCLEDGSLLNLCPAHSSTQRKGKVGCGAVGGGGGKLFYAEEQHPQGPGAPHIQESGASTVQPDSFIPNTKHSCTGRVVSQGLIVIVCLIVSLKRQLKSSDSFARLVLRIGPHLHHGAG